MDIELSKNFEYFERKTPNTVEKLIKKQGDDICHNKIGTDYIKDRLKDYDFGFTRTSNKAQIGQRRTRQTEQHTYSFVLCKIIEDPYIKEIDISLICSRPTSKDGKLLMELVENKAKQMKYQRLSLVAVGNTRLLHWYESLGFILISEKPIINSDYNAYSMRKNI